MKLYNSSWVLKGFNLLTVPNQKIILTWVFQAVNLQIKNAFSEDSVDYFDIKKTK